MRKTGTRVFGAVGVTWVGDPKAAVSVAVRSHVPKKGWTGWRAVGVASADRDPDGPPTTPKAGTGRRPAATRQRPTGGSPRRCGGRRADLVWLGAADGIEVQVSGPRKRGPADIVVDLIDPAATPRDATAGAPAAQPDRPAPGGSRCRRSPAAPTGVPTSG